MTDEESGVDISGGPAHGESWMEMPQPQAIAGKATRLDKENVSAQTSTATLLLSTPTPKSDKNSRGLTNRRLEQHALPSADTSQPSTPPPDDDERQVRIVVEPKSPFQSTPPPRSGAVEHEEDRRAPPGSSKLLRRRFHQISLTPQRPRLIESGAVRMDQTPNNTPHKRLILAGAVRTTPHHPLPKSAKKTSPRVGYDGTLQTPSRELLRSTACSRSHQVGPQQCLDQKYNLPSTPRAEDIPASSEEVSSVMGDSLDSALVRVNTSSSSCMENEDDACRDGCENPVALTLLNDGREDLQQLLKADVSHVPPVVVEGATATAAVNDTSSTDPTISASQSPSPQSLLKVSNSLLDVMDQSDVATLARPVAVMAKPQP